MNIIFVILPIAITFAVCAVIAFVWAVKKGQYDDLETPALRVLFEDSEEIHSSTNDTREN